MQSGTVNLSPLFTEEHKTNLKEYITMDTSKKETLKIKIDKTIEALKKNNMNAYYAEDCKAAVELAKGMIKDGDVISHGGSVTLKEAGFTELFNSGSYTYLDRSKAQTPEEIMAVYRRTFSADAFFTSSNAVTVNGELYNVDGNSNRVSAMLFGPEKVIVVVGYNKIVNSINDAVARVKELAAPANCVRLDKNTYCSKKGKCVTADTDGYYFCAGCKSEDRICCNYTVMSMQRQKGRVNVIIVGEELGY